MSNKFGLLPAEINRLRGNEDAITVTLPFMPAARLEEVKEMTDEFDDDEQKDNIEFDISDPDAMNNIVAKATHIPMEYLKIDLDAPYLKKALNGAKKASDKAEKANEILSTALNDLKKLNGEDNNESNKIVDGGILPTEVKTIKNWIDREFSWLQFNDRVLEQFYREDIPFSERIKFISIADSNLAEFISVRFAETLKTASGEYISMLRKKIQAQKVKIDRVFYEAYRDSALTSVGEGFKGMDKIFAKQIQPFLTPIAVGVNKEVPVLNEKDVNFFVKLKTKDSGETMYCFLQIPHQVSRFIEAKGNVYLIEDIVEFYISDIFNTCTVEDYLKFVVYKDYSEEVVDDTDTSIVTRIEEVLQKRQENHVIFMDIIHANGLVTNIEKKLMKLLKVSRKNASIREASLNDIEMIGVHALMAYPKKLDSSVDSLKYNTHFKPRRPEELEDEESILDYLKDEDLVLHHPYDKYDVVVDFIREASADANTVSIKQTLYRVSSAKSPIIEALCTAARNGIKVTVMLELLARFDERQNVSLINKLKKAGVNIVYSLDGLKTHCKMCLITQATKKSTTIFSHVSTGNYNEKNGKVYTDISYFTSKPSIGAELNAVFNMITGFSKPTNLKQISYSPDTLRSKIVEEMKRVCEYTPAEGEDTTKKISIKVNSISDEEMVKDILGLANMHPDVEFNIICRGICSLPTRENIHIHSVVGRFLEHSRIYMFETGKRVRVFISSADLLTRNLDKRVETLIAIQDSASRKKISKIFSTLWEDTANTYVMNDDGEYVPLSLPNPEIEYVNAQDVFTRR